MSSRYGFETKDERFQRQKFICYYYLGVLFYLQMLLNFLPSVYFLDQPLNDLGVQRNNPPLQTAISVSKYRSYLNNFWNILSSKLHLCSEISIRTRRQKILKRLKRRVMLFKTSNNSSIEY